MPARRILQLGDPMLRAVSQPVASPAEAKLILRDLRATLHEFRRTHGFGRGISAVQIGELKRVIYLEFEGSAYSLINPAFERQSEEKFRLWDDCFSFPDLLVYVERSQSVAVRYQDEGGETRLQEAEGALSELLQHEMDHLDGILAIDRALDRNSFATREEFERRLGKEKGVRQVCPHAAPHENPTSSKAGQTGLTSFSPRAAPHENPTSSRAGQTGLIPFSV